MVNSLGFSTNIRTSSSSQQGGICIPVYRQGTENRKLVGNFGSRLDEGGVPVSVSADGTKFLKSQSHGEWMTW